MSQTHRGTRSHTPLETELGWGAVGWTMFAGLMMIVQGCWWFIAGLVTLLNDQFSVGGEEYISQFATTTLG